MARTRNRAALDKAVKGLREAGLLDSPRAVAVVAACRSLAEAVDAAPLEDRLWGQYLRALDKLGEVTQVDGSDDDFDIGELLGDVPTQARDKA